MNKEKHILPNHVCPCCGSRITWQHRDIKRLDGYYDWCLDVCCDCGEVVDPEIVKEAYNMHARLAVQKIREQQNAAFDKFLGTDLHMSISAEIEP